MGPKLNQILSKFPRARILVVGDLILDEFIWGNVSRISPEAPVPVVQVRSESFMPGGAANVANNIAALGGKAYLSGVIGNDKSAALLRQELKRRGIDLGGVVVDGERPTIVKTRIIAHHQQVVRVDRERPHPIADNIAGQILAFVRKMIDGVDAVIVEDYGKGVVSFGLISRLIPLARRHKKIITIDPKADHFAYYKAVTSLTPNIHEASDISGIKVRSDKDIDRIGKKILRQLGCQSVLLTLGEEGMRLFLKQGKVVHIPTVAQEVFDVSGAGDTVIAVFTQALCCGASLEQAAYIANYAAGIVVGKVGVASVTCQEIRERMV
ncbi:MAG: D-glycero-beta-D-manno-heptose-7-phosphate kinase [Candidatus Omnitrophota bacterium]